MRQKFVLYYTVIVLYLYFCDYVNATKQNDREPTFQISFVRNVRTEPSQ